MVRRILRVVVPLFVAATTLADVPFLGRWKFNSAKSEVNEYKLTFTQVAPGEMKLSQPVAESTFKFDGTET